MIVKLTRIDVPTFWVLVETREEVDVFLSLPDPNKWAIQPVEAKTVAEALDLWQLYGRAMAKAHDEAKAERRQIIQEEVRAAAVAVVKPADLQRIAAALSGAGESNLAAMVAGWTHGEEKGSGENHTEETPVAKEEHRAG